MEATSQPVTQPLSDVDRKILGIMDKLGWGVTVSKLSEYADVDPQAVQSSLNWLSEQGLVEAHQLEDFGWLCWYRSDRRKQWPDFKTSKRRYQVTCPYCGKNICYTHPPSGRGRHPPAFLNHLSRCNIGIGCRERYDVADAAWSKRTEVV